MMLNILPDPARLHQALLDRDAAFDGRVWVCVTTTGIFCRLSCPARKPLPQNCRFQDTIAACLDQGFRPCKRCRPMAFAGQSEPAVAALLAALDADPARRWSESDVAALGHDPSTVRRQFRRAFGRTFLDLAREARVRAGTAALGRGERVIDAQLDAGFDSADGFREAFGRMLGLRPSDLRTDARLRADWIDTDLGTMIAVADDSALYLLEFADRRGLPAELSVLHRAAKGDIGLGRTAITDRTETQLTDYLAGRRATFDLPLAPAGTPFQMRVWRALQDIPAGQTRSYAQLATAIGQPTAMRAVARANGANRLAIVIPCHRVIGADGTLTGYGGGLWRKDRLIGIEAAYRA